MSFPSIFNFYLFLFHQSLCFSSFKEEYLAGNMSFQPWYLWRQNVMGMVFFSSQSCLQLRQTLRQCDILAATYSFSGFLSAACLSGQKRRRKKGKFKCGNDFLCIRGCELERHLLVLISGWLENNPHFLSPFPNCWVLCRRIAHSNSCHVSL